MNADDERPVIMIHRFVPMKMEPLRIVALLGSFLCGCGASATTDSQPVPVASVASVSIVTSPKTFRALGDAQTITANALDASGGIVLNKVLTWSTSDATVATVNANGVVTAVGAGSAQIKAAVDGFTASIAIGVDPWIAIAAGGTQGSCGIVASGNAYCWGIYAGSTRSRPVQISTTIRLTTVSGGSGYWCGVSAGGAGYCWGSNVYGQLGDGTRTDHADPLAVLGVKNFLTIAIQMPVGINGGHACGLATDSTAYCWGVADAGQLGIGNVGTAGLVACNVSSAAQSCATSPRPVSGGLKFRAISTGNRHTCAIAVDSSLYCWGDGIGSSSVGSVSNVPSRSTLPLSFSSVGAKFETACGVTPSGDGYCWGSDVSGKRGGGPNPQFVGQAVKVAGNISFASISPGLGHTCGVAVDGRAYCWGANSSGQIGNGTTTDTNVPVAVSGGLVFKSVVAGDAHTCGLALNGATYCWGEGSAGQLGDATLTSKSFPSRVVDP